MNRFVQILGLLTIVLSCEAIASGQNASAVSRSRLESPYGHKIEAKGVPELIELTPTLYRGGQPTAAGFQTLARMGIGIVVDMRELHFGEGKKVRRAGMQYVAIRWYCLFPKDKIFAQFLSLIRQNPGKKIFVHCRLGDDRVGMMIAAYRMADEHWTAEEAMQEMRANGFTLIHHLICPRLARYEKEFPSRYKTDPIFHQPFGSVAR